MASSSSNPSIEVLGASEDPVFEELHSALREFEGADAEEVDQALDRCRGCELDQTIDTVAELMLAYVTMREEKRKRQAARKDQKFGAPSSSTAGPQSGLGRGKGKGGPGPGDGKGRGRQTIEDRKAKTKCFDCGQAGHWSEDPSCLTSAFIETLDRTISQGKRRLVDGCEFPGWYRDLHESKSWRSYWPNRSGGRGWSISVPQF
jgi:hypothetical protein